LKREQIKLKFIDVFTHLVELEIQKYLPSFPYLALDRQSRS